MSDSRTEGRRPGSRKFRPALDGRLEERVMLNGTPPMSLREYLGTARGILRNPQPRVAYNANWPPFLQNAPQFNREFRRIPAAATQTIRGGKAANVITVNGTQYRIQLAYMTNTVGTSTVEGTAGNYSQGSGTAPLAQIQPANYPQAPGTVRVYPMPGGKIGIIVDGSTENTQLTINPLPHGIRKGYAHSYAYGMSGQTHLVNVGQITVNSGRIGSIEGYHTANLSGPIVIGDNTTVDRIAFNAILPGASIRTGGSLNTLEVLQSITLNTGTNIEIGRDLNLLNAGGNIDLSNGSQFKIGRDLAAVLQPPKGTGTGSNVLTLNLNLVGTTFSGILPPQVGTYIQGNLTVGPGSAFVIGRNVNQPIYIIGDIIGASRIVIPNSTVQPPGNTLLNLGQVIP
jgi:hypothetical protein